MNWSHYTPRVALPALWQDKIENQLGTVRQFLAFCGHIDAVPEGLSEKLELPELGLNEEVDHTMLYSEEAERILPFLEKYEYASCRHAILLLLWHTGIRISTLRAFDVAKTSIDSVWEEQQFTFGACSRVSACSGGVGSHPAS